MRVLVVVDMQNDFINGALGTPEAQGIVKNVVDRITQFDGDLVCITKDTHQTDYLKTQEGLMLPVEHCIEGTWGWQVQDMVAEAVNKKNTFMVHKGSFGSVELGEFLTKIEAEEDHITEVTFVGLCTDICVISNALLVKAFLPEAKIIVDAGCCAGVTPESHKNAIEAMKMCQICIENLEE